MNGRPFPLPEDLGLKRVRPAVHLFRACASVLRSRVEKNTTPEMVARKMWGRSDEPTQFLLRAVSNPAETAVTGWAAEIAQSAVKDFIASITSLSAGADLIGRGLQVPLDQWASMRIPGRVLSPANAGAWLAEGMSVPVRQLTIIGGATLLPRRLVVISSYTKELSAASLIEETVKQATGEAAALVLDGAILGSQADDGATPQGILHNVAPLTPTAGGGMNALTGDIKQLMAALAQNGAGKGAIFIGGPTQIADMKIMLGPKWDYPLLASQVLAATNTLIALEPSSFVSGFFFAPEFSIADATALHEEDTSAGNLSGGVPVRSLFQTNALALKMSLRAAFGMRANGHVQVINGCTW